MENEIEEILDRVDKIEFQQRVMIEQLTVLVDKLSTYIEKIDEVIEKKTHEK